MDDRARLMGDPRDLGHRLNGAGLVVGEHHRHQCGRADLGEHRPQRGQIDDALAVDRDCPDLIRREAAAGQHRRMLGRPDQQRAQVDRLAADAPVWRQHRVVGLGAAAGECDQLRIAADQTRHRASRLLDPRACGAALGMHRRGVADLAERRDHGLARLGRSGAVAL